MRLSIIQIGKDESVFYNLGIFKEDEKLIVFPFYEFENYYEDNRLHIKAIRELIIEGLGVRNNTTPVSALLKIKDHILEMDSYSDKLMDFDVQTTLKSFSASNKTRKRTIPYDKEKPQCLIGL
ncbi:MAG: hypothetical protein Kow0019_12230 [Methanobacteriaceae archaeon]